MAQRRGSGGSSPDAVEKAAAAEPQDVVIEFPGGHRESVSDPTYLNSAVYGMGAKVVDMPTNEAVALVVDPSVTQSGD